MPIPMPIPTPTPNPTVPLSPTLSPLRRAREKAETATATPNPNPTVTPNPTPTPTPNPNPTAIPTRPRSRTRPRPRRDGPLPADREEPPLEPRVRLEDAEEALRVCPRPRPELAADAEAGLLGVEHTGGAARAQVSHERLRDVPGKVLLEHEAVREAVDDACELPEPDDLASRHIGDVREAPRRQEGGAGTSSGSRWP